MRPRAEPSIGGGGGGGAAAAAGQATTPQQQPSAEQQQQQSPTTAATMADAVVRLSTTTTSAKGAAAAAAAAPPPPPQHPMPPQQPPPPARLCLGASEVYCALAHHGQQKATYSSAKVVLLGTIAGALVSFGFALCLLVGGNMPASWAKDAPGLQALLFGAVGFPFGFTCIVLTGAELFTSMCAYTTAALMEGGMNPWQALRLLVLSWLSNFAGCALFVGLALAAGLFDPYSPGGPPRDLYTRALAHKKAALLPWGVVFARGVLANALVALAVWMANAAQDLTGKAVGIWLTISAFAMFGIEHSIANMFLLPMGVALGEPLTAREIAWRNLFPSTLGNWVGGAGVAAAFALSYGTVGRKVHAWWDGVEEKAAAAAAAALWCCLRRRA